MTLTSWNLLPVWQTSILVLFQNLILMYSQYKKAIPIKSRSLKIKQVNVFVKEFEINRFLLLAFTFIVYFYALIVIFIVDF